ncbi:NADH-quinone oxidoreductase subunit J [bacterium]|nr:NADH-quinone oxidoreductase subunit J [bacterium]
MIYEAISFYSLAMFLVFFAYKTISAENPIHSALYLVLTMLGLGAMFFTLGAEFIAGVQVIVYAGAVMVLFVMVLMLFDLKAEVQTFSKGLLSGFLKVFSAAALAGLALGVISNSVQMVDSSATQPAAEAGMDVTKNLSILLYTKYLFSFEVLGVLLLVVAVGAVALSRMKGGTHARRG